MNADKLQIADASVRFRHASWMVLAVCACLATPSARAATTVTYTYDGLGRLASAARSDGVSYQHSYDALGNFVSGAVGNPDTDGDGMSDAWETSHGLNPNNAADAAGDPDLDGLGNLAEYLNHTDPNDWDSDADGVSDGDEIAAGTDPLTAAFAGNPPDVPALPGWGLVMLTMSVLTIAAAWLASQTRRLDWGGRH